MKTKTRQRKTEAKAMSERAMLEIRHFTKSYGGKTKAADDVNLSVYGGDICGFIGHNGAGKSTTIRAVVGVLDFSRGEIFIDGHSVKDDPIACKQVTAYIPDNPDLYENLTGIQYLNFTYLVIRFNKISCIALFKLCRHQCSSLIHAVYYVNIVFFPIHISQPFHKPLLPLRSALRQMMNT